MAECHWILTPVQKIQAEFWPWPLSDLEHLSWGLSVTWFTLYTGTFHFSDCVLPQTERIKTKFCLQGCGNANLINMVVCWGGEVTYISPCINTKMPITLGWLGKTKERPSLLCTKAPSELLNAWPVPTLPPGAERHGQFDDDSLLGLTFSRRESGQKRALAMRGEKKWTRH